MVVKINFSPVSSKNIRAGYACTANAFIGLAGIRGKTCFSGQLYLENCVRTLRNFPDTAAHQNNFYRECQPIKREPYPCTRSQHGNLRLTQEKNLNFTTVGIDFYHHGEENVWFHLTSLL